jgi:hypothetical protein
MNSKLKPSNPDDSNKRIEFWISILSMALILVNILFKVLE